MKLLFVCVGNACRSQMAEGLARAAGHEAESAGTNPASAVAPEAIAAMQEIGIDISGHVPKSLDWDALGDYDRVITMGCGVAESCPALQTDADWGLDDPIGQPMAMFRLTRDEIKRHIEAL